MAIKPWVVGNWKMNPSQQTGTDLIQQLQQLLQQTPELSAACQVAIAPTTLHLLHLQAQLHTDLLQLVAQDVSRMANTGAYTGEVSASLLKDSQIHTVLIGHSERREYFGDTTDVLAQKIKHALDAGLHIIYCVGESLEQREQGQAETVVLQQICDLASAITQDNDWCKITIAYEPIWAIGTGKTASAQDAQAMHQSIRQGLAQITPQANSMVILYGGSVKAENAPELAQCPDINGALVGGASLDATGFYHIIRAFATAKN